MIARMVVLFLAFLVFAPLASAEVASVKGGEHADFTRLVVEAASLEGWQFGRTDDGYELSLGASITAVDLERAFDRIPRDRITAIWRDPQSGNLRFSLACACHAIAFEFRPGTVVVDIKSGLPPKGSSFEDRLEGPVASQSDEPKTEIAETPGYNWIAARREAPVGIGADSLAMELPTGAVSLDPLREALLVQISKGVAEGAVEIGGLSPRAAVSAERISDGPWSRVTVGEMPGLTVGTDRAASGGMTVTGKACLADSSLDVSSWGLTGPISSQVGLARSGLLAEFDEPVAPAIYRAARFHIYLGFGAEARQILEFLGPADDESEVLLAMASIVDQDVPKLNPFDKMESCDSSAALWAILALPNETPALPLSNIDAVVRSFSALPPHLRQQLGAALVDRFIANGDEQTARRLRDAILRSPNNASPEVALMDARFHLAEGDEDAATRLAGDVLKASGPTAAEAALTLVEAAFRGNREVPLDLPETLDSFLMDAAGTNLEPQLLRALVLSAAMSGDFHTAFQRVEETPETFPDLWSLSARNLPDEQFLVEAARRSINAGLTERSVMLETADRLMELGFPDLALAWLLPIKDGYDDESRLLAAKAHLAMRDAPAVVELLTGVGSAEAAVLRAAATTQLGDMEAAAKIFFDAGEEDAGQRHLAWTQDWAIVSESGPENWRGAAELVADVKPEAASGPIAQGTALVEESAAARARIEALLGSVAENSESP